MNENTQVIVRMDESDPSRFMVEVKPSHESHPSRRQVHSQDEVARFAREHQVDPLAIDWNGFMDRLPERKPKAQASQR